MLRVLNKTDDKPIGFSLTKNKAAKFIPYLHELNFYAIENLAVPHIQKLKLSLDFDNIVRLMEEGGTLLNMLQKQELIKFVLLDSTIEARYKHYGDGHYIDIRDKQDFRQGISLSEETFIKLLADMEKWVKPLLAHPLCSFCVAGKMDCTHPIKELG
jgi:hypothetical protein